MNRHGQRESQAIALYLGIGHSSYPHRHPAALEEAYGLNESERLKTFAEQIMAEVMTVPIDWNVHSLTSGTDAVMSVMRQRHPELTKLAITALGWYFSFAWK